MEVDPMIIVKKFNDVSELQKLQRIACSVPEDVYLHSMDDSIMVDLIAIECHDEAHSKEFLASLKKNGGY